MQDARGWQIPNQIQSREYSTDGGTGGISHIGSIWRNLNDNRNVAYLYGNADNRKLNLNWYENRWNDNYRFAAVRNSLHSSV